MLIPVEGRPDRN